jgi:protein disulfide-isomerase-like protein
MGALLIQSTRALVIPLALLGILVHLTPVRAGMYGSNVVELTSENFKALVIDSSSTWLVKFYAPWCGHCQQSAPAFSKAAKKLEGIAKLGVVNGDDQKDLSAKYGIRGFPSIKIFKGEGKKERRPSDYTGERTASAFAKHVKYVMPSYIARIKESGLEAFFQDESALPHVILFTERKSTVPLYKGMSAEFRKQLAFGEVRKSEAGDLSNKFGIDSYPTLIAFKKGESDPKAAVAHSGSMDPASLRKFFQSIAAGVEPEAGGDAVHVEKVNEPVFAQPKAFDAEVVEISSGDSYKAKCGSRSDGRMCGLAFLPGGKAHKLADDLAGVAQKFQYDNMAFGIVDTSGADGGGSALAAVFGITDPQAGGFVYVRARKGKFAVLRDDAELSGTSITSLLDRVVGGDARYQKLTADLPVWRSPLNTTETTEAAKDSTAEVKKDESDASPGHSEDDGSEGRCGLEPPADGGSCGADAHEPKVDL